MDEQSTRPGLECRPGLTAIEQIARVDTMRGSAGASFHPRNGSRQIGLTFHPIQNAEGLTAKFRGFEAIFSLGMVARRGPGLIHMQDFSLLSNLDPELMVKQKVERGVKAA